MDETGTRDCKRCGGIGWVKYDVPINDSRFGKLFPCSCMKGELARRRQDKLREITNLTGSELSGMTFDKFDPNKCVAPFQENREKRIEETRIVRAQMVEVKRLCVEYAENPKGWLILQGNVGSGKTMLACAIANEQWKNNRSAHYETAPDILSMLREGYKTDSFDERMKLLADIDLLVLDDLGAERGTEWAEEQLYVLLNNRYRSALPLVVTTNERLESTKKIHPRIVSRLRQGTERMGGFSRVVTVPAGVLRPYV